MHNIETVVLVVGVGYAIYRMVFAWVTNFGKPAETDPLVDTAIKTEEAPEEFEGKEFSEQS